ncbi:hypothetical protein QBC40DRAFT_296539 [Triangularia verruculosa]|uniref:MIF4G domain-containing protein n=1 Tax=Triangularia verruculosa TaxID=2587418 RepID=A0AAN7AX34_9PEZI|nr:hypothetical protein QBC40DRAFT_296539 [Triangularia verruculosa]
MTSTASQNNPTPATASNAPAAVPSYASAAGASKKPASTPLIATGSHPPVVAGSTVPPNGKSANVPPMNGRQNITPAVPVARGTSIANGSDHTRKPSVTISANAPAGHLANGGPVGGSIKFGFESPAIAHSTPQPAGATPIPIPGGANPRVASPAHSPSPIPQSHQSGGGLGQRAAPAQGPVFGSFPGEADRHMKQHGAAMAGSPHVRRDSQASAHGEHGGPGHGRGNFQGGRGGRGSFSHNHNHNHNYNNNPNMGFPPNNRNFSGPNAGHAGRGMPAYRGGYPASPQPHRASPAGTPTMAHGTPVMAANTMQPIPPNYYPPAMYMNQPPVMSPFINKDPPSSSSSSKPHKNKKQARREADKASQHMRGPNGASQKQKAAEFSQKPRRQSKLWDQAVEYHQEFNDGPPPSEFSGGHPAPYSFDPRRGVPMLGPPFMGPVDLSPESGGFERLLTANKMQMNAAYMDPYRAPYPQNPYMAQANPYTMPPGAAPFNPQGQTFVPQGAPYQTSSGAPPMSRNASQISDRPASSTGPAPAPPATQGTPQPRAAAAPPAIVSSTFARPKKSTGIIIKDPNGNVLDIASMKAPSSPAPPITQQSKTPPVIASTPTPPPKSTSPSHSRNESTTGKTAETIRNEFKNKVMGSTITPADSKAKDDEAAAKAAAEKAAAEQAAAEAEAKAVAEKAAAEKKAAEEKAAAEKAAAEKAAAEKAAAETAAAEKAAEEERLAAQKKAAEEAEEKKKAEAEAEAKAKADAEAEAAKKPAAEEEKKETEDEYMERMIREMEEEDQKREAEQAEITKKKEAEKAAKKAREEADKKAANSDEALRAQEREMERLEEEKERKRAQGGQTVSVADLLTKKIDELTIAEKPAAAAPPAIKTGADKPKGKPAALNLAPLKTAQVEAPQPSAALQSLRSARFLPGVKLDIYPEGILSPNPSLNAAVQKKGKVFKYDAAFLLQFKQVFTEQPSMEFHQQVKTLIGDTDRSASARTPGGGSGRQGSRAGASSAFPSGGAMGQFGAKPLPPGTTSEQRFAMSQGGLGRPPMGAMGGFGRGGFPTSMSRNPSAAGGLPSPRTGSRRGGSKREGNFSNAKAEAQAAKTMPLTAGMEVKPIQVSSTGWKPTSINKPQDPTAVSSQAGHLDPEMVQRKVKAALNKMTPEKFDKIADQILTIAAQSKNEQDGRTLRQVIQLTFEKATDEAHWASMYAKFCKRMLESMSPEIRDETVTDKQGNVISGGPLFRKYLLNRCQTEFERGWKSQLPPAPEEGEDKKTGEAAMLSDEYYIAAAAKRRGLGLVQFIGELFKLGMLTERIMHECVRKLLEYETIPDEAEIESLTKLLRTIGGTLDSTEKGRIMMDAYFQRIDSMMALSALPSRLKFMLMDIVDLRRAGWHSKEQNKGPKTLEEVRAEAEAAAAQKAAENARSNQRGAPGGRPMGGRQDSRNFSYANAAPNTVASDDLRRLKGSSNRSSSQNMASFGPTSMFNSRSNSGRRMGGPGGAFGRAGEDSGASSRTGTPPVSQRDSVSHANAFSLLAETDLPNSPPSTHASPALPKATLDSTVAEKKE